MLGVLWVEKCGIVTVLIPIDSGWVQSLTNPAKQFTIGASLARCFAGGDFGSGERLSIFPGLPHQGPELLRLLAGVFGEPLTKRLIVFNQALSPSLALVQSQCLFCAAAVLDL